MTNIYDPHEISEKIKVDGQNQRNKTYPDQHFDQQAREWGRSTEISRVGKGV